VRFATSRPQDKLVIALVFPAAVNSISSSQNDLETLKNPETLKPKPLLQ
jgi:hypothetical protein